MYVVWYENCSHTDKGVLCQVDYCIPGKDVSVTGRTADSQLEKKEQKTGITA